MENGTSPVLLERFFKYIDIKTCRIINAHEFQQYVTFDKFCTETKLGNTNLDSDSRDESIDFILIHVFVV